MKHRVISSPQNTLIKKYKKLLKSPGYRRRESMLALEGPNLVQEAIKVGLYPSVIFYTEQYYEHEGSAWLDELHQSEKYLLDDLLFKKIADTENPRAVAAIIPYNFTNPLPGRHDSSLFLILDRVQDPGNMGTIIRTAAAVGVHTIYCLGGTVDPFSPKVLRATAGNIFRVSIEEVDSFDLLAKKLMASGIKMVAAVPGAGKIYWEADLKSPIALMIGNEARGLDCKLLNMADIKVQLPLAGKVESLNASVAAGVILYEALRQRSE